MPGVPIVGPVRNQSDEGTTSPQRILSSNKTSSSKSSLQMPLQNAWAHNRREYGLESLVRGPRCAKHSLRYAESVGVEEDERGVGLEEEEQCEVARKETTLALGSQATTAGVGGRSASGGGGGGGGLFELMLMQMYCILIVVVDVLSLERAEREQRESRLGGLKF
ncbi:hypothetical protein HYALB_00008518 [Hymenoscyphus albidus]|uniref:Uncharacterized protein n=1 Tax=Hymenoscyphus albidus TaxID=595503 RepID=A0A9N9LQT0_9HELO|nr:hypothetical protein HYALB_00008518 [Hymenoscyphus albidus]